MLAWAPHAWGAAKGVHLLLSSGLMMLTVLFHVESFQAWLHARTYTVPDSSNHGLYMPAYMEANMICIHH